MKKTRWALLGCAALVVIGVIAGCARNERQEWVLAALVRTFPDDRESLVLGYAVGSLTQPKIFDDMQDMWQAVDVLSDDRHQRKEAETAYLAKLRTLLTDAAQMLEEERARSPRDSMFLDVDVEVLKIKVRLKESGNW